MRDLLSKLSKANRNLKKLSVSSGSVDYSTFSLGPSGGIPETWCPELRPKIKPEDLPNVLRVNGGTP